VTNIAGSHGHEDGSGSVQSDGGTVLLFGFLLKTFQNRTCTHLYDGKGTLSQTCMREGGGGWERRA
jgi:hypothetical protein